MGLIRARYGQKTIFLGQKIKKIANQSDVGGVGASKCVFWVCEIFLGLIDTWKAKFFLEICSEKKIFFWNFLEKKKFFFRVKKKCNWAENRYRVAKKINKLALKILEFFDKRNLLKNASRGRNRKFARSPRRN